MYRDKDSLSALQDQARKHALRLKILALAQRRNRSLDPEDLRRELPEHPAVAIVGYHLSVLERAKLLPSRPAK